MKILLAVDGSSYSKKMLAYLAAHEALLSGDHDYTVIHRPARRASPRPRCVRQRGGGRPITRKSSTRSWRRY